MQLTLVPLNVVSFIGFDNFVSPADASVKSVENRIRVDRKKL